MVSGLLALIAGSSLVDGVVVRIAMGLAAAVLAWLLLRSRAEAVDALGRGLEAERIQTQILKLLVRGGERTFVPDLEEALRRAAAFCQAEAGFLCRYDPSGEVSVVAGAAGEGAEPIPNQVLEAVFADAVQRLQADEPVTLLSVRKFLKGRQAAVFVWNPVDLQSLLLVPVFDQGRMWGAIGVHSRTEGRRWTSLEIHLLRVVAEVMSAAWGRYRAETSLKAAMEEAQASSQAKSRFLANMSHEIRTPLNCVVGLSEHLCDLGPTAEQRQCLDMIRHSADVLLQVINDVLDISRIEAGKVEIQTDTFDLPKLLHNTVGMFTARTEAKHLLLDLNLAPDLPLLVRGDEARLGQILTNLLGNAVKFTHEGGICLAAAPVPPTAGNADERIRFDVIDSGVGIAPDKLEKIFDNFTQADASTTRLYGGAGLGLAISRSLAGLMNGALTVASVEGQGSVFTLEVPLPVVACALSTDPPVADETAAGPASIPPGCRVLVVEDNSMNQMVARKLLVSLGCEVTVADDGPAALDLLSWQEFDLVLMDYMMPGMDGPETVRRLRARGGRLADLPVVALTANALESHRTECLSAGMDGYLTKPIRKKDLIRYLASLPREAKPV